MAVLCELITARTADNMCRLAAVTVGQPKTSFSYNTDSVHITGLPGDGASRRYVPSVLILRIISLCHDSAMAGGPSE